MPGTHGSVTAVDQDLHDGVVLVRVHRGQVVKGAVDGAVSPLGELTGQMSDVTLVEFTFQYVCEKLQTKKNETLALCHVCECSH